MLKNDYDEVGDSIPAEDAGQDEDLTEDEDIEEEEEEEESDPDILRAWGQL